MQNQKNTDKQLYSPLTDKEGDELIPSKIQEEQVKDENKGNEGYKGNEENKASRTCKHHLFLVGSIIFLCYAISLPVLMALSFKKSVDNYKYIVTGFIFSAVTIDLIVSLVTSRALYQVYYNDKDSRIVNMKDCSFWMGLPSVVGLFAVFMSYIGYSPVTMLDYLIICRLHCLLVIILYYIPRCMISVCSGCRECICGLWGCICSLWEFCRLDDKKSRKNENDGERNNNVTEQV